MGLLNRGQVHAVDDCFDLLTLSLLPGMTPPTLRKLRERGSAAAVLGAAGEHEDLLGSAALRELASGAARLRAEAEQRRSREHGARLVGWCDDDYPRALAQIFAPPAVLYVRGELQASDSESCLAVVGSRAASPQGVSLARGLARDLAGLGLTIVSGLARGIDSAAHRGALEASGRTVAVLGSGLDRMYPPENADLATAIERRGGAVVSEFPLGTPPYPGNFPKRNRIIAGWSRAVLVIEAAERSGALSTARQALDEGREVLAVPGHPSYPGAAGTNALIRDGAALVRDARDVADTLGLEFVEPRPEAPTEGLLAALPKGAPISIEDLHRHSGQPLDQVLAELTRLELSLRVRRLPGALYVRN